MQVAEFCRCSLDEALNMPDAEINAILEYKNLKAFLESEAMNEKNKDFDKRLKNL